MVLSLELVHSVGVALSTNMVHSTALVLSQIVVHSTALVLSSGMVHSRSVVLSSFVVRFRLCVPVGRCYVVGMAFLCEYVWLRWWCAVLYVIGYVMPVGEEELDCPPLGP